MLARFAILTEGLTNGCVEAVFGTGNVPIAGLLVTGKEVNQIQTVNPSMGPMKALVLMFVFQ